MARRLTRREIGLIGVLLAIAIGFLWFRSEDPFGGGVGEKDGARGRR